MRYQVPQFVDIEDKIIGPLTLKQFLIYVVTVMLLVPVYLASDMSLFITIAIPVLGLAALFAHFKLHGRSLFAVIGHASAFMLRGQLFVWRRVNGEKGLPIMGQDVAEYDAVSRGSASLSDRARALETVGNIVNADADDPISKNTES
jgi:hypothetical protein